MEYIAIHRRLFQGIYKFAGKIRDYNITKKEWVLGGETVLYASYNSVSKTLEYDFEQEKNFNYEGIAIDDAIIHISKFVSNLWQIHAFGEGNTRTTAVFCIKYLRTFGFSINNDVFAANSWYFRNALVRANYNNINKGIFATTKPLERYFRNFLLGEQNELKNRFLHIDYNGSKIAQSAELIKDELSKCNPKCKNYTLEETTILHIIRNNPKVTQKEMAKQIGKSERTVKSITVRLTEKGVIERKNGKRNGYWSVIQDFQEQ